MDGYNEDNYTCVKFYWSRIQDLCFLTYLSEKLPVLCRGMAHSYDCMH